jgi:hypothetical protein
MTSQGDHQHRPMMAAPGRSDLHPETLADGKDNVAADEDAASIRASESNTGLGEGIGPSVPVERRPARAIHHRDSGTADTDGSSRRPNEFRVFASLPERVD